MKCPCCNNEVAEFYQFKPARKACPHCGSLERHRALWIYLREIDIFGLKTLHFAPEPFIQNKLKAITDYVSVDIKNKNAMILMDITSLGFPDNIFDLIICSHVLEHVVDEQKAVSELYRVLKPGGQIIIQVPLYNISKTYEDWTKTTKEERLLAFKQEDHVRKYGKDIKSRLEQCGMSIEIIDYAQVLGVERSKYYGFSSEEPIIIGR